MSDEERDPLLPSTGNVADKALTAPTNTGRRIGWASAYIMVVSRVIGSGIFAMPGTILQNAGSPGLALLLWVLGAAIAWCSLAIDLEYGCMLPRSGGIKIYLEYTYQWPRFLASTLVATQAVLLGFTASNCIVFAKYILFAAKTESSDLNVKSIAIGLITFITIIHGCFYRTGVWVQNTLGWIKVALIIFMILTGLFVVSFRPNTSHWDFASDDLWKDSHWGLNNLSTSLFKIFYSYAGLNNINNILNEVRNPVKTLKSVTSTALFTCCIMYVLINIAYLGVVPLEDVKQSRELIAALFFQRVFGQGFGNFFLPISIALSAAGNVMVVTFSLARLNQEIAKSGFLPFSKLLASSRPFDAPLGGLIVHLIPSVIVIAVPPSASVYAFIADVEGYASQFFSLALAAGLIILRIKKPQVTRPYRAWLPAVWVRIVLSIALIIAPLFPPKNGSDVTFFYAAYAIVGLSILVFGLLYWYIWTIVLPWYGSYKLVEETDTLDDGTTKIRLVRQPIG